MTALPENNGVIRRRSNDLVKEVTYILGRQTIDISPEKLNKMFERAHKIVIPNGYTVQADNTGDCYKCAFCKITGEGEDSQLDCVHPNKKTGCVDGDIVFVEIKNED